MRVTLGDGKSINGLSSGLSTEAIARGRTHRNQGLYIGLLQIRTSRGNTLPMSSSRERAQSSLDTDYRRPLILWRDVSLTKLRDTIRWRDLMGCG